MVVDATYRTIARRMVVAATTSCALLAMTPAVAGADRSPPGDADGLDIEETGEPLSEEEFAEQTEGVPELTPADQGGGGDGGITAQRAASTVIDDFEYNPADLDGRAADICTDQIGTGTLATYREVQDRFGGSPGTLNTCRERYNAEDGCYGRVIDPVTNPNYTSDCWSYHATGRAWDLMVGTSGGRYNVARGNAVVDWLLSADGAGNYSSNARKLGIQQILWNDRCWDADGDRGTLSAATMRKCGIGHFDHIHVDMTERGRDGLVGYWDPAQRVPTVPRPDALFWLDGESGNWLTWSWFNYAPLEELGGRMGTGWNRTIAGDWDSDGISDDTILWNTSNGVWNILRWTDYWPDSVATGSFPARFDSATAGDFDSNGLLNDLFLFDNETGDYQVYGVTSTGLVLRNQGRWSPAYTSIVAGDLDEDGRIDDLYTKAPSTGAYRVVAWAGYKASTRVMGNWSAPYTRLVVADLDSDGEMNDMFLQAPSTGAYAVISWNEFRATVRRRGTWSIPYNQLVVGDFDSEGRNDDLLVRATSTGAVKIYSWRYYLATIERTFSTSVGYDQTTPGTWGY